MKLRAKRLLALAMAGVMALSMAGCGGSGDSGKETTGQTVNCPRLCGQYKKEPLVGNIEF